MVRGDWFALLIIGGLLTAIAAVLYFHSLPEPPGEKVGTARITEITYYIRKWEPGLSINGVMKDGRRLSAGAADQSRCHVGDVADVVKRGMALEIDAMTCVPPQK